MYIIKYLKSFISNTEHLIILFLLALLIYSAYDKLSKKEIYHDSFSMTRKHIKGHDYIIVEGETGINIIHAVDCEMKDIGYNE
jgi:flagellar biosynthesis protein FlhB